MGIAFYRRCAARPVSGLRVEPYRQHVLRWCDVVADRQIELRRDWDVVLAGDFLLGRGSAIATAHGKEDCRRSPVSSIAF